MPALKKQFLLDPSVTFLNHGSFGATPRPVFRAYQHWQRELERQPVEFLGRRFAGLMRAARTGLADYLGTTADNLIFATNVTEALNVIARSLDLGPGDEVLATDHEYGALDRTWRFLAKKRRFTFINRPVVLTTPAAFVESFWAGVNRRTRVVFLSHITSPTALRFPVEEIVRRARQAGILSIVDGAHAPGQLPLRLDDLGADFYGGNLHKWLCAPKGAGFLYARPEVQALVEPLVVSWGYEAELPGPSRFVDYLEWTGTRDYSAYLSVPAAIEFQRERHWEEVCAGCHRLAMETRDRICDLTGLAPLAPSDFSVGLQMAAAPLPGSTDIAALKTRLYDDYRIEIPLISWNGHKLIRISVQGYNTRRDTDGLLRALKRLL